MRGIMVNGDPLSTLCTPSEEYWRPSSEFSEGEPLATSSARPKAKNPWGPAVPQVVGLRSGFGCGQRFALRFRGGTFNLLPREYIKYSRETPYGQCYQ